MRFGQKTSASFDTFFGSIDEIKFFNREVTTEADKIRGTINFHNLKSAIDQAIFKLLFIVIVKS
ncbi:MAG: hypothetical protein NVS1B13_08370 [Flavisolibacter sp.]